MTHSHIEELRGLATRAQSGKRLFLPGLVALKEFDCLVLATAPEKPEALDFSFPVEVPGRVTVPQLGVRFHLKIVTYHERKPSYNIRDVVESAAPIELDPLKLSAGLILRSWRPGDRFQPLGSQKPSKLKDLLRQCRVPIRKRALWPVLESGAKIVWVRGLPPASFAVADLKADCGVSISEEPL